MHYFERFRQFLREVKAEMEKVTWPGRDEIRTATIVIVVLVVILASFIGAVDFVVSRVLGLFFRL